MAQALGGRIRPAENLQSGKAYRGINVFLLSCMPYSSAFWLTFKQAKARGGSVMKGERGCPVIFWKWPDRDRDDDQKRDETERARPILRRYTVFNVEQCEGIDASVPENAPNPDFEPIEACERIVSGFANGPEIVSGGSMACYSPEHDRVRMPSRTAFHKREDFYATLYHELGHSTGHEKRLARNGVTDLVAFGSHAYSREELVAEMTAAYQCGQASVETLTLDNSAAYLASWLKVLRQDSRVVVQAAAQAQKAVDHILGICFQDDE